MIPLIASMCLLIMMCGPSGVQIQPALLAVIPALFLLSRVSLFCLVSLYSMLSSLCLVLDAQYLCYAEAESR